MSQTIVSNADSWREAISAAPSRGKCSRPETCSRMPQITRTAASSMRAQKIARASA